jgi:hypothetical protein
MRIAAMMIPSVEGSYFYLVNQYVSFKVRDQLLPSRGEIN